MSYYDKKRPEILETHIFDCSDNLYGKEISVVLKKFIRKPKENLTIPALKKLIAQDAIACKNDPK
jgi:FAD synthase